jgi:hypothetical protein
VVNSPGLDKLAARFAGRASVSVGTPAEPDPVDELELEPDGQDDDPDGGILRAVLGLTASVGRMTDALDREARWRDRQRRVIRSVPIQPQQITLTGGGGTLDVPDAYMLAKTGYTASIRRLACWGFSAGTVNVWLASPAGELVAPFAQAGVATYGRGEQLMQGGERIVFVASGITGIVQVGGKYDLFESWYEPYYIG